MAFPDKLKALRLRHKLTQDELGEKLCLSRTSISYYEQGKFEPDSYGEYTALVGMGKIKSKYRDKRDIDLPLL